ncbi:hypothetical protein ACFVXW_22435 [Streptomyces sp. NPDC058251]
MSRRNYISADEKTEAKVRQLISRSFDSFHRDPTLKTPNPAVIRAGRHGGLPFDSITSDLFLGCLPATQICYGNCFAARSAFEAGFDFGKRVPNILDEDIFREDLAALPINQCFLRIGWNSDASWDWDAALRMVELIAASNLHSVFVTKYFHPMSPTLLRSFASHGAELRVSISALDTPPQLQHRLDAIDAYRRAGGLAVPIVMSAPFRDEGLLTKQRAIVDHVLEHDFPAAENSLRFSPGSPMLELLNPDELGRVSSTHDLWGGRLFSDELRVPTITSVPPEYHGLESSFFSRLSTEVLTELSLEPVRTHSEVLNSDRDVDKPRQCGVSIPWPIGVGQTGPGLDDVDRQRHQ